MIITSIILITIIVIIVTIRYWTVFIEIWYSHQWIAFTSPHRQVWVAAYVGQTKPVYLAYAWWVIRWLHTYTARSAMPHNDLELSSFRVSIHVTTTPPPYVWTNDRHQSLIIIIMITPITLDARVLIHPLWWRSSVVIGTPPISTTH